MLLKEIPFLRIGLPLCVGIISGQWIRPDFIFLLVIAAVILIGLLTSLFFNKLQTNYIYGVSLTVALYASGLILYHNEKERLSVLPQEPSTLVCTVSEYPEEKENSFRIKVKLNQKIEGSERIQLCGSMIFYNRKDSTNSGFLPGDRLIVNCTPLPIENRGNPYEFDYRFYMENNGVKYFAFTESRAIVSHATPERINLIHRAQIIRESIIGLYRKRGIEGEQLAIVAAITLGQKTLLEPDQKENFIRAGVVHIMAVSGLHAMILSLFVFYILFFMKRKLNTLRVILTILVLWSFAFITGLAPSVQRASLMFTFLQAGHLIHRRVNPINSVLASAFVLILIRPSVIFGTGFLLSYSAVIFIICFFQDLYLKIQPRNRVSDFLWKSAVVTLVAQAGTLPLTIALFNRFPAFFILTNIIIVPLASAVIVMGSMVLLTFPATFISKTLAYILVKLTGLAGSITETVASIPFSSIERIGMTSVQCLLLFIFIFLFMWFLLKKDSIPVIYPLVALLLLVSAATARNIMTRITDELIVYNTAGSSTIGIRAGKTLFLFSDTSFTSPEVTRHCATLGLRLKGTSDIGNDYYLKAGQKNILVCNSLDNSLLSNYKPDIVILKGSYHSIGKGVDLSSGPGTVIITSEASSGYNLRGILNIEKVDTLHYVRKSGAFTMRL
ncbi:MAG: ComEC/Rec2 family competence protein [Bacteroidales bacterium]